MLGERQNHLTARPGAPGLDETQVASGNARLERKVQLAHPALVAPLAEQLAGTAPGRHRSHVRTLVRERRRFHYLRRSPSMGRSHRDARLRGVLRSALCPTLVRREDQLAILEEALLAAHRGEGRFVVVSGEAGISKTRLGSATSEQARRLDSSVLWGGCSEAELSLPYLPFVEAIGNHLDTEDLDALASRLGPSRSALAQLFPQLSEGEPDSSADPAQAKMRLFEAIISLLTVVAEQRALVLVIEDVHWADDSTRELLDHLA